MNSSNVWLFSLILLVILNIKGGETHEDPTKVRIVYFGDRRHNDPEIVTASHLSFLGSFLGSEKEATESMIYSYRHGFSGFAAHLTDSQAREISEHPDVIQVWQNHFYKLQTIRTFNYLGLYDSQNTPKELLREAKMGEDIILGIFDSGVWPESESFNDRGLGPIPNRWKGRCVDGTEFNSTKHCNNKLIGARFYMDSLFNRKRTESIISDDEYMSARERLPHGSHVASTAGGSFVSNVSYQGLGVGTVRGGAPNARIAVYKICWRGGVDAIDEICATGDILKAIDDAIEDGVDVMSFSLGSSIPLKNEIVNEISFGAFHAISKGIPVLCAGGNDGPEDYTVQNIAAWTITVAASSLDRWYPTPLLLGNNVTLLARTPFKAQEIQADLMYVESSNEITGAAKDKVVFAFVTIGSKELPNSFYQKVIAVRSKALIVAYKRDDTIVVNNYAFAYINIDYEQGATMQKYIRSTSSPTITINSAISLSGPLVATKIAAFSGRGPNSVSPHVLKPDIAAPGMSILAASTPLEEDAKDGFAIETGTSMSTPVVTGLVALLRAVHRDWSPAAIKSALVTTASTTDPYGEPIFAEGLSRKLADPFDFGGGLVNPSKAVDPGLVYDASPEDYMMFLCASGYEETSIAKMANQTSVFRCPTPRPSVLELNLPSITVPFLNEEVTVTRTVSNVGPVDSVYTVMVEPPMGVKINVMPKVLLFNCFVRKLSFQVSIKTTHRSNSIYYFGILTWTDGSHDVTIPLSVRTQLLMSFNY